MCMGKGKSELTLTQSQINAVNDALNNNNSLLITQKIWSDLNFNFSKLAFSRRAKVSNLNVKIGYDWSEYVPGIHSTKAWVQLKCNCSKIYLALAIKLMGRQHRVEVCPECYKLYLYDEEWRAKNSKSQLIAQNRPEVLERHRKNSRRMWKGEHGKLMRAAQLKCVNRSEYKENMARIMREKWASDVDYRDRVSGKGVYKHTGNYNEITYHSKLELAFLMWCTDNAKNVQRCKFGIPYIDPVDNKEHDYYPDFIVDEAIVEVKGQRWIDASPDTYRAKINALAHYCELNKCTFRVVLDKDLKSYARKATTYHEAQKQKNDSI